MVTIRAATPGDEPRLVQIDRSTWSPLVTPSPETPTGAEFFQGQAPTDVLVAAEGTAVLGFLRLSRPAPPLVTRRHVLLINGLGVDPAAQRKGIGTALVRAAVDEARSRGARRLTLRVLSSNPGAVALYTKCGFTIEGTLKGEFLIGDELVDDVLMGQALVPQPPPQ